MISNRPCNIFAVKMVRSGWRKHIPIFVIGLLALALRILNSISTGEDFYANSLSDASTYRLWASRIVSGASGTEAIFPLGPLYPYFLALNLKLGLSFYYILYAQAILGTLSVIMIGIIAGRVFNRTSGVISAILAALYAPFILYDGLLLSESLQIFLLSCTLLLLIPNSGKELRYWRIAAAGILIGLACLGRATVMFFPLFLGIFWMGKYLLKRKTRAYWPGTIFLFIGIIIGVLPATLHNVSHGEFVPISSNFGINFYIGNNDNSSGSYDEPPGLNLSTDFTGRRAAERESGRPLKASEVSSFWSGKAFDFIVDNPLSFLSGILRKIGLYLWYFDIPQAESIQIQGEFSPLFKLPLPGFGLVLLLGIIGLVFSAGNKKTLIPASLLAANIIGVMAFFVIGRFKLIGSLGLLILTGGGAAYLYRTVIVRDRKKLLKPGLVIVAIILILISPRPFDKEAKMASAYDNVGIFHYFKGRPEEAINWYRRAQAEMPDNSNVLNNIGAYHYQRGAVDSANFYFHESLKSDPRSDKTLMNIGRIAEYTGMIDSAIYYYRKAKEAAPFGVDADSAIAELEARKSHSGLFQDEISSFDILFQTAERAAAQRQFQRAEEFYKRALEIRPDDIRVLNNLGYAYQSQAKFPEAAEMFARALATQGDNAVAFNNMAGAVYRQGKVDSAIVLWEMALMLDPGNAQIKKNLDFVKQNKR